MSRHTYTLHILRCDNCERELVEVSHAEIHRSFAIEALREGAMHTGWELNPYAHPHPRHEDLCPTCKETK